jgi:dihydroxyacetone kinase
MERVMDGTSGALYSITFNALAAGFHNQDIKSGPTAKHWAIALSHALESLYKYTNARPPSRTLVDPLDAFTSAFAESEGSDLDGAVSQAREAAEKTKDLVAKVNSIVVSVTDPLLIWKSNCRQEEPPMSVRRRSRIVKSRIQVLGG